MKIEKYFALAIILFISIFSVFFFLKLFPLFNSDTSVNSEVLSLLKNQPKKAVVKVNNLEIMVDIADTQVLQTRGLSGRSNLNEFEGMLFVFPESAIRYFWMKDMLIPIDIIWIDKEGKIIGIEKNIAKPEVNTPDNKLPVYSSPNPVSYVLEVNSGFSEKHNVSVNDTIQISQ